MSHLLQVQRWTSKVLGRPNTVPLCVEYHVSEDTAPFLVSSSSSVTWVQETLPGGLVRAAVRDVSLADFSREVLEAVCVMGRQQQWGNVYPLSREGVQMAVEHVDFYEQGPLELLIPRAHVEGEDEDAEDAPNRVFLMPPDLRPLIEATGLPFRPSAWVPEGTVVVVPRDRAFVGVATLVTPRKIAVVVHNASRGIAIARADIPASELAG